MMTIRCDKTCTQAFAEAEADRVKWRAEFFQAGSGLSSDVPDPCTVQMHLNLMAMSEIRDPDYLVLRKYRAIKRIFKLNDLRRGAAYGINSELVRRRKTN